MRFMGFSKGRFLVRFAMVALVGALGLSLGVVSFPAEAEAGVGKRWVYAAKFKCIFTGDVSTSIGPAVLAVQTIVNIYNPTENSILFTKHYVIQAPQFVDEPSQKTDKESESVGAGLGHAINCKDIVDLLELDLSGNTTPSSYIGDDFSRTIEGWVIIEAPKKDEASKKPVLSVCANYQHALVAIGSVEIGAGITVDVECFEPKKIKPRF